MRTALLALALAFVAVPAHADEGKPQDPEAARAQAIDLARTARRAWDAGNAARAAELWGKAADLLPDVPLLRYDQAVALEKAGDRENAAKTYRDALSGATGEVEQRALFNASALSLEDAWAARELLRQDPAQLTDELRAQATQRGLGAAKDAIRQLRDLLRRAPGHRDAMQNLELAQGVRRELVQEQEQQEQDPSEQQQGEQNEKGRKDDGNQPQEGSEQEQQQEQPSEDGGQGDEQDQDQQGDSSGSQDQKDEQEQGEGQAKPRDLSKEQAERLLEQLLEAAARKAREVRELQRQRARRTPVEKDW